MQARQQTGLRAQALPLKGLFQFNTDLVVLVDLGIDAVWMRQQFFSNLGPVQSNKPSSVSL